MSAILVLLLLMFGLSNFALGVIAVLRYETEDDPVEGIND